MFSEPEVRYLKSQRLARIATVSRDNRIDVVPVGFEFDGKEFFVGSHSQDILLRTRKYRNVKAGNRHVAMVIDDMESIDPWRPRGIKIEGKAEVVEHNGMFGPGKYLRIVPTVSWSWGIKGVPVREGMWMAKTVHRA